MSDEEKKKRKKEYEALLLLFMSMLHSLDNDVTEEEALYQIAKLRTEIAMSYAYEGFKITKEEALLLLMNLNDYNLTQQDIAKRDRLVAALNNISEFSTCEEYQVLQDVKKKRAEIGSDIDFDDEEMLDEYEDICEQYNDTYAAVENDDIKYAMVIAATWLGYSDDTYLEYWTQNDDRVRPWHMALQGFVAKASEFPSWMIPPIEWRCRCFLQTLYGEVIAKNDKLKRVSAKIPQKPKELDGVFDESVAKCGRIFGKAHRYFNVNAADKEMLDRIVNRIKGEYYA